MLYGGCSQEVKAMGCDSIIRGFDSRHSPLNLSIENNEIYYTILKLI